MTRSVSVALVSDTHGSLDPRIVRLIHACDVAVHAGDVLGSNVLDAMCPRSRRVIAVAGNNDVPAKWSQFELGVVEKLPHVAQLELPGGVLVVEHGHRHGHHAPRHDLLRRAHPNARAIVYGHSHKLVVDQDDTPWVLNPGAAGRIRTYGGPSCLVLTATQDQWNIEMHRFALHDEIVLTPEM